jgi:hypothetical protein
MCTLTAGQKESAKRYIIKTADHMIELTSNCQRTLAPALSQSIHVDDEVEAETNKMKHIFFRNETK